MKYANTLMINGIETIATVLPLSKVPGFDPSNPPQNNTYGVPDEVEVGWIKGISGQFEAPVVVPSIPASVTRRQFKLGLLGLGLLDSVEAMISASNDRALQINWAEALDFERNNPFVAQMAVALGKSDAEIDAFFVEAKTL